MDHNNPEPMTPFDELVTSRQFQMIKLLIPFLPVYGRQIIAAYVKIMELKKTFLLFRGKSDLSEHLFTGITMPHTEDSLPDFIRPYLKSGEAQMLDSIITMKEMLDLVQTMQASSNADSDVPFSPADILSGFLSPEQQEMFRSYSDIFSDTPDKNQKGDESIEPQRSDE